MRHLLGAAVLAMCLGSTLRAAELGPPRIISVPVTLELCQHVTDAIVYEDDVPTSSLPVEKTFHFNHYADVGITVPELVRIEVEARHVSDNAPFVGRVSLAPVDTDTDVEPRHITVACERHCLRKQQR